MAEATQKPEPTYGQDVAAKVRALVTAILFRSSLEDTDSYERELARSIDELVSDVMPETA